MHSVAEFGLDWFVAATLLSCTACCFDRDPVVVHTLLCLTGNNLTEDGYTALLKAAVEGPAFAWIQDNVAFIPQSSLAAAGLPRELAGNVTGTVSYLRQLHKEGTGNRRASLILVGPQAVGKSSLLWRMQHPNKSDNMTQLASTNGFAHGEMDC